MTINLNAKSLKRRVRDCKKYAMHVRVIADGRERHECFYYDGRRRILGLNKLDENGNFYLDSYGNVAVEFVKFRRVKLVRLP